MWGSSPLARGLQEDGWLVGAPQGIIPARAGFTWRRRGSPSPRTDHPRSRGVYERPARPGAAVLRIIPARAGFTSRPVRQCLLFRDHPRSRGVYSHEDPDHRAGRGSSPLARGLPLHRRPDPQGDRIIPARAGFTPSRDSRGEVGRDHPRSRGVYDLGGPAQARQRGSSPLARGLPCVRERGGCRHRIIPARAGFTSCSACSGIRDADHPRSRGVYAAGLSRRLSNEGSSPLARGLLQIV